MWIMEDALPDIKCLFRGIGVKNSVRAMIVRFMIAILVRHGKNSCMHAASVIQHQPRHRAQPGRFLQRVQWRAMNVLGQLVAKVLARETWTGEYLFLVDSTLVAHQGESMENTYSTGYRKRHPKKNRRYHQYKYAGKSCHCFVFGLLITPDGLRMPFYKPLYTKKYAQQKKLQHRTQAQLAALMVICTGPPVLLSPFWSVTVRVT